MLPLGWFFIVFGAFIIVGAGNAVNLTDGLDGLATVPVIIVALSFGFISYLTGNAFFADYLNIHYVPGTGELAVLCGAVIGSGLGFLWYNAPPASVFMEYPVQRYFRDARFLLPGGGTSEILRLVIGRELDWDRGAAFA